MSERPLVVFVGPPAAGKSKLARLVAKSLGVGVVDTDSEVAKQWGSIPEIFEKHGETFFRQKEREAVTELFRRLPELAKFAESTWDPLLDAPLPDYARLVLSHNRRRKS